MPNGCCPGGSPLTGNSAKVLLLWHLFRGDSPCFNRLKRGDEYIEMRGVMELFTSHHSRFSCDRVPLRLDHRRNANVWCWHAICFAALQGNDGSGSSALRSWYKGELSPTLLHPLSALTAFGIQDFMWLVALALSHGVARLSQCASRIVIGLL